jgi:hypothetical protein
MKAKYLITTFLSCHLFLQMSYSQSNTIRQINYTLNNTLLVKEDFSIYAVNLNVNGKIKTNGKNLLIVCDKLTFGPNGQIDSSSPDLDVDGNLLNGIDGNNGVSNLGPSQSGSAGENGTDGKHSLINAGNVRIIANKVNKMKIVANGGNGGSGGRGGNGGHGGNGLPGSNGNPTCGRGFADSTPGANGGNGGGGG